MDHEIIREGSDTLRQQMNRWVAQFAPLVMDEKTLTPDEARRKVDLVRRLREESDQLQVAKSTVTSLDDAELLNTFQLAVRQLPQLEADLRRHLNLLAPGDPEPRPCLTTLQDRLQEKAARQEMGLSNLEADQPVEAKTAEPSVATAAGIGIFALGWNGFTLFHATMMLGGMIKSFGFLANLMGLFYLPFLAVGVLMIAGVVFSLCSETIRLDGHQLTVTYRWGRLTYLRKHQIDVNQLVKQSEVLDSDTERMKKQDQIEFTDVKGKPIRLARGLSQSARESLIQELNAHILCTRNQQVGTALAS